MAIQFRTTQVNCVLLTPQFAAGAINSPSVQRAIGEDPTQAIQLPDFATTSFPSGLQLTYIEAQPQRFALTIVQNGEAEPSGRWKSIAQKACAAALRKQPAIGFGLNFLRIGVAADESARGQLRDLLRPSLLERISANGIEPETAGIKLLYPWREWRVTLNIEPDSDNAARINANSNFHLLATSPLAVRNALEMYQQAYESFVSTLDQVLIGEDNVD